MIVKEDLYHYGVKGMKWYQRSSKQETEYRNRITNIMKVNKNGNSSDGKKLKYRNQSVAKRIIKTTGAVAAQMVIQDILSGQASSYKDMSNKSKLLKLTKLATETSKAFAINELMVSSVVKKYDANGKRIKGNANAMITREDIAMYGTRAAIRAVPILNHMAGTKALEMKKNRLKNEALFNKWGANILPQKLSEVVWHSEDLQTIITNPGR